MHTPSISEMNDTIKNVITTEVFDLGFKRSPKLTTDRRAYNNKPT